MRQRKAYPNAYREKPTRSMRGCPVLGRWSLERLDFTFLNGRLQWILEALEAAMQFKPGLLIGVLPRYEAGNDPAMFRDQDRLTRVVDLINQRQAFCFKLGCGDLHMTSMDDQSLDCQSAPIAEKLGAFAAYCFGAGGGYRLLPRLTGFVSPRWQVQQVTA